MSTSAAFSSRRESPGAKNRNYLVQIASHHSKWPTAIPTQSFPIPTVSPAFHPAAASLEEGRSPTAPRSPLNSVANSNRKVPSQFLLRLFFRSLLPPPLPGAADTRRPAPAHSPQTSLFPRAP